jgi:membrane associated rhomboid family serine protease
MLPLVFDHEAKTKRWPYVTICLIGINVLVFAFELSFRQRLSPFLLDWGLVPARMRAEVSVHNLVTAGSSIFLHSDALHLLFNLWFLWVFGDSLEDAFGHWWYLLLYLASGFFGSMAFVAVSGGSPIPVVGASGAISGVLGASLVVWPTARLRVPALVLALFAAFLTLSTLNLLTRGDGQALVPLGLTVGVVALVWSVGHAMNRGSDLLHGLVYLFGVPAWFVLGVYLLLNLWAGAIVVIDADLAGNVGFVAHIGGFIAGAVFAVLFPKSPVELGRQAMEV